MENKLMTFKNDELGQIRIAVLDGEPIFNLYDTCFNLGYVRTIKVKDKEYEQIRKDLITKTCESLDISGLATDWITFKITYADRDKIDFENTWIDEQSFYDLCLESKAKHARAFRRWVTGEVLPSIRKTGSYSIKESDIQYNAEAICEVNAALLNILNLMNETKASVIDQLLTAVQFYSKIGIKIYVDTKVTTDSSNANKEKEWYTVSELAEMFGIYSKNGRPAKEALNCIISRLNNNASPSLRITDAEKKLTYPEEKGWKEDTILYNDSVIGKIAAWFVMNNTPHIIEGGNREYEIIYKDMSDIKKTT